MSAAIIAGGIEIGVHPTAKLFGLTFDLDTILSTVVAGAIVIALGFWLRSRVTSSGVPSRIQVFWETVTKAVEDQVEGLMGVRVAPCTVPLGVALFLFILVSNWIELIPTDHKLPAPTADANTPYALALLVIVWVHAAGTVEAIYAPVNGCGFARGEMVDAYQRAQRDLVLEVDTGAPLDAHDTPAEH